MVISATMMNAPMKYTIILAMRATIPPTASPDAAIVINCNIPRISPNINATDAIASDAATMGIEDISCNAPAGVNNNFTPPTLGIMKL